MHSLEGCFLKSFYKGQLLVAMAKDGNNQMLPLAWAVVEKENKNSWTVFLKCIRDVGLGEGGGLTLTTDMQKGLYVTIEEVLPQCEHRKCARHIFWKTTNWSKDWRGLQRKLFWKIAKSTFKSLLRKSIEKKLLGPEK